MDIKTIIFCLFIINLFLGVIILVIKQTQKGYKGFDFWIFTSFLMAFGYLFLALRNQIPDFISIVIANTLFLIVGIIRIYGFCFFFNKKIVPYQHILVGLFFCTYIFILGYYTYYHNSIFIRTGLNGISYSAVTIYLGVLVLRNKPQREGTLYVFTAVTYFIYSLISIIRITGWIINPSLRDLFNQGIINNIMFMSLMTIDFSWTLLFFVMNNHKITFQLLDEEKKLQKWEDIFRHTKLGVAVVLHGSEKFNMMNPAFASMHGYTLEELTGQPCENVFAPEQKDEMHLKIKSAYDMGHLVWESIHIRKDGSKFPVFRDETVVYNPNGEPIYRIVNIHDITDQKRINNELVLSKVKAEESDRLKTAFLHNMSHEIRTPMNAIMGFSDLLVSNYNNKLKLEKFSEIIRQRCNDLLYLINDILDIAKIESGQLTTNLEVCSLNELFIELTTFFKEHQKQIKKQQIVFSLEYFYLPTEDYILTDKVKLKQIFINLISNAFKFTDEGTIKYGCKRDDIYGILFFVSDTGIGIPKDKQNYIFKRFTQVPNTNNWSTGGTGLGLSIVEGLIQLLGGQIWLESEPEKGTTFYFSFSAQMAASNPIKPKIETSLKI